MKYFFYIAFLNVLCLFSSPIQAELPIVVTICSYNNAPWVVKNLDSVLMQNYSNFSVVYIDDASQDGTADLVREYIHQSNFGDRFLLIQNEKRQRKMKNIYTVFHQVDDEAIIVQLDGDDWFAHENVLAKINETYLKNEAWFTYGQFIRYPKNVIGLGAKTPDHILRERSFRSSRWIYSHPKTFYAWLFKSIRLVDVLTTNVPGFRGQFFPCANDLATVYPMLEMSGERIFFISDIAYVLNEVNPISTGNAKFRKERRRLKVPSRKEIKSSDAHIYDRLKTPLIDRMKAFEDVQADVVLFVDDQDSLFKKINQIKNNFINIAKIHVVCSKDGVSNISSDIFDNICFHVVNEKDFFSFFKHISKNYVVLCTSQTRLENEIDCRYCIQQLEKTYAHACYFSLSPQILHEHEVPYQHIWDNMHAWKFACDKEKYIPIHSVNGVLYRKKDLLDLITSSTQNTFDIQRILNQCDINIDNAGLFFE